MGLVVARKTGNKVADVLNKELVCGLSAWIWLDARKIGVVVAEEIGRVFDVSLEFLLRANPPVLITLQIAACMFPPFSRRLGLTNRRALTCYV